VACVFSQCGINYEVTFALVAKITTIHTLIIVALVHKWPLYQMSVKNVFLNGNLSEIVYM